jgi:hypothetical protein
MLMGLAIAPAWPLARERLQLRAQRSVVLADERFSPLRRPRLTDISARPSLREAETVLKHQNRPPPA